MLTSEHTKALCEGSLNASPTANDDDSVLIFRNTLSAFRYHAAPRNPQFILDEPTIPEPQLGKCSFLDNKSHLNLENGKLPTMSNLNQLQSESQDAFASAAGQTSFAWLCDTQASSSTCRKAKKHSKARGYAPPEKYNHLNHLQDYLEPYQSGR
jgi:hypothetical protein